LVSVFVAGPDGVRPANAGAGLLATDPRWTGTPLFYEYFDGDDGHGLGASHQTGWTGLVADLIIRGRGQERPPAP